MPGHDQETISAQELLQRFVGVTVWHKHGNRAPHKPLLLLLALARLQRGEGRLIPYEVIHSELNRLLAEFGPTRPRHQPEYPFWNLQRDGGIWEIPERAQLLAAIAERERQKDVPPHILREYGAHGGFPASIDRFLRDRPELVFDIARTLLFDNFPRTYHEDILDAVAMPWVPVRRDRRPRDSQFRTLILHIYEERCAVCGFDGRLHGQVFNLDAAHIKWHAAGGPDRADNGLALCAFHHRAFDRGALGVDEDGRIVISPGLAGGDAVDAWLTTFAGQRLNRPLADAPTPAPQFLSWHRTWVFRDSAA